MYCINHDTKAKAICVHCGKALCGDCIEKTDSGKIICSPECLVAANKVDQALELTLQRSTGTAKSSAVGAYLLGLIFIIFGFFTQREFLYYFLLAAGVGMLVMGGFYHFTYKKNASIGNVVNKSLKQD